MKSVLILLLSVLLTTATINAQNINLGLKAGLNFYNVHNDNGSTNNTRTSFHAGLLAHIHMNEHFGLQPEVVYSSQGATNNFGGTTNSASLNYLNIPIMLQYMFGNGFRVEAGPQLGVLLSATNHSGGISTDVKNEVESIDLAIGAGISYVHVPTGFGVDLRYNLGLSDISKLVDTKSINLGLQLGIFYLFNHKS